MEEVKIIKVEELKNAIALLEAMVHNQKLKVEESKNWGFDKERENILSDLQAMNRTLTILETKARFYGVK